MGTKEIKRKDLAALYSATVLDYFCGSNEQELIRESAEITADTLHKLGILTAGTIPALIRVIVHYATTATDFDKAETLGALTTSNGAAAILARITAESDRLNVWGDILESIGNE